MKTSYKSLFTFFLLLNCWASSAHPVEKQSDISKDQLESTKNPSEAIERQPQTESSDICASASKGKDLLESNTLAQQLVRIELKKLLAKVKEDIKRAPHCLSDKDYTPIMHLLQKKKEALEAQIKTLELTLPEEPESIDVEDLLQKSFTVIASSFAAITVICLIIQSSREDGQYHSPSLSRLWKNIRG